LLIVKMLDWKKQIFNCSTVTSFVVSSWKYVKDLIRYPHFYRSLF